MRREPVTTLLMKAVYHAATLVDAQIFADCLEGNGIPCVVLQQNAAGGLGELPVIGPEVWIRRDADQVRAVELVSTLERNIAAQRDDGQRHCAHCSEISPAGFDICWRCGRAF